MTIDVDAGTTEATWQAWPTLRSLPAMTWGPPRHLLVVAPHPDDEVLGPGGTLHGLGAAGWRVTFIAVTDGEASHPGSTAIMPMQLAVVRRAEAATARAALGLGGSPVRTLGVPDGQVASHHDDLVAVIVAEAGADAVVLAPWRADGHPDHDACGAAAAEAASATGARLVEYPVWTWNWAEPEDARVPWGRARATTLGPRDVAAKAIALQAFRSQVLAIGPAPADAAVLPAGVMAYHQRPFEIVFA